MPSPWPKILAGFAGLALAALLSLDAAAYHHSLSSYNARDAYFLGTDSHRVAQFLTQYVREFALTKTNGAYVAEIEVLTPYVQVVENSRQHSVGYSALQAEEDYKNAGDIVQVRVRILYPLTQTLPLQPPPACAGALHMNDALACFPDFDFRFTQGEPLHPGKTYGTAIYSATGGVTFIGGDIWFTFSTSEVASAALRVTVTNPNGRKVSAAFDLATLL